MSRCAFGVDTVNLPTWAKRVRVQRKESECRGDVAIIRAHTVPIPSCVIELLLCL